MEKSLISVLTPTYNRAGNFLPQLIESVQKQCEDGFEHEHIIVDDCSTDNTRTVVQSYSKHDKRIKYFRNRKNSGSGSCLNRAFTQSSGSLVIPVDDDDLLPFYSLQLRHDFMANHPKADWSYGSAIFIDDDNRLWDTPPKHYWRYVSNNSLIKALAIRNFIPNGAVTIRRPCIAKVGGWRQGATLTQDYEMWQALAKAGCKLERIDGYLSFYRLHKDQISGAYSRLKGSNKKTRAQLYQ